MFSSNKQYPQPRRKNNKENKNPKIITDHLYKKTTEQPNATFGNNKTNNRDIEGCIDNEIVDIST